MAEHFPRGKLVVALAATSALALAGVACAQTGNAGAAATQAYTRANLAPDAQVRDASGTTVTTDGVIQSGQDESTLGRASGTLDTIAGVGSSSAATMFGSGLQVVTADGRQAQPATQTTQTTTATSQAQTSQAQATQDQTNSAQTNVSSGDSTLAGGVSNDQP